MTKSNYTLSRSNTAVLIVDVQEKLFPQVERSCEMLNALLSAIQGFKIMNLPIVVTEQYPEGLGSTLEILKQYLGEQQQYLRKTTFSCLGDSHIEEQILKMPATQWIVVGMEAHVCVMQTAKDLLAAGREVVVLNDAISSRSIYDFSTAIAEMRDCGARISSVETVLFELLRDSQAVEFKQISQLIKNGCSCSCQ